MRKKKEIPSVSSIVEKAVPILKKHDVKRASIFGSFARGSATSRSDVDFLIEYKGKNKSLFDLVDLKLDLEEILGRKVDITTYQSLHYALRERIFAEQMEIL
jgi:predicted nucleotidyltransferase